MSSFDIVIPVYNKHDVTRANIGSWISLAKGRLSFVFIDNGSDIPLSECRFIEEWSLLHDICVIRNRENVGVFETFQQAYEMTSKPYIFYSHNDVEMLEPGWDLKLERILADLPRLGACGMFGARGLGKPGIYKTPYHFTQLMRWNPHTVEHMVGAGAVQIQGDAERTLVLDGFSMIFRRKALDDIDGFDHELYTNNGAPHHCYDNRTCLRLHFAGWFNYVIDIDCIHHGGKTSCGTDWADKFELGTDLAIHRRSHEIMYEEFRGRLPAWVKN